MAQNNQAPPSLAPKGSLVAEARSLLSLGVPAAGTQLAFMLLGVVDTAMLGHYDAGALAAAGIGNMWHWAVTSFFFGVVLGVEAVISQGFGRGDARAVALGLQRGLLVALLGSIPAGVIQALAEPALLALGQDAAIASDAGLYCILRLPSIPAFLSFIALRTYMQGRGIVWPAFWVSVLANFANAALNWVLIFGNLGAPAMGLEGAALATSITSMILPLGLFFWMKKDRLFEGYDRPWDAESISPAGLRQMWKLGLPIGLQTALEGWAFAAASGVAGWLSVTALASYQVTLSVAATLFMVPLGLSIGAATRVGNLLGAGRLADARRSMAVAFGLGGLWSLVSGGLLLCFRGLVPGVFTADPAVKAAILVSLPAVAGFQFFDGTQAIGAGLLRAMGRPRAGAVINGLGFFGVALPLAHFWAVKNQGGVVALWYSLAVGLGLVATGVSVWVFVLSRRSIEELQVAAD